MGGDKFLQLPLAGFGRVLGQQCVVAAGKRRHRGELDLGDRRIAVELLENRIENRRQPDRPFDLTIVLDVGIVFQTRQFRGCVLPSGFGELALVSF